MKEVVLGKEEQKSAEDTNKVTQPTCLLKVRKLRHRFANSSNILEEEPQKHDDDEVGSETDDEVNEEDDLEV